MKHFISADGSAKSEKVASQDVELVHRLLVALFYGAPFKPHLLKRITLTGKPDGICEKCEVERHDKAGTFDVYLCTLLLFLKFSVLKIMRCAVFEK